MTLASTVEQLKDKLSDLVVGPAKGSILVNSTTGTATIPQGLIASLPDGRLVRVLQGKRVTQVPTLINVRLLSLSPSTPPGNFSPVVSGLVATWIVGGVDANGNTADIPSNLAPTGITNMFGYTTRAGLMRVGSCVEACELKEEADLFKCGAQGGASVVILDPETAPLPGWYTNQAGDETTQMRQATWKLRVNVSTLAPQKARRVAARDLQDNLIQVLNGGYIGDDQAVIGSWRFVRRATGVDTWELVVQTKDYSEGRAAQPEAQPGTLLTEFDAIITLPGDADQPAPFRVRTNVKTSKGFSKGFDNGFGAAFGANNVGFNAGFDVGFG